MKVAVLARYREENNSWENTLKNNGYSVIIFNKFSGDNLLNNVGRESHTYLHYILENYDNLPDEILFSQYDPLNHFKNQDVDGFLNCTLLDFVGFRPTEFCFKWTSTVESYGVVSKNKYLREYSGKKIDWVGLTHKLFGYFNKFDLISCGSNLTGMFRVPKHSILRYDREFYLHAIKMLDYDPNPIEGYYFERIWKYMFFQIGLHDPKYKLLEDRIFKFGHKNFYFGNLKLDKDGNIRGNSSYYSHSDESYWKIKDDLLYIMQSTGGLSIKFDLKLPELISSEGYFLEAL